MKLEMPKDELAEYMREESWEYSLEDEDRATLEIDLIAKLTEAAKEAIDELDVRSDLLKKVFMQGVTFAMTRLWTARGNVSLRGASPAALPAEVWFQASASIESAPSCIFDLGDIVREFITDDCRLSHFDGEDKENARSCLRNLSAQLRALADEADKAAE